MSDWHKKPLAIMGHVFDYWLLPQDHDAVVARKRELGFSAEHWLGSSFKTGGESGHDFLFRCRHGFKQDLLAEYLPAAHRQGLKVLVYINVHWFADDFHPEMLRRGPDGKPAVAYGSGALVCPGGPFLDWALAVAEDVGEYDVDGVFLDGPISSLCYCESCQANWQARHGGPLPRAPFTLEQRRQIEDWNADKTADFVRQFRDRLRQKRPGAIVYHNGSTLWMPTWANRRTVRHADMLGIEGGFIGYTPLQPQFLYKTAATGKLLRTLAGGKPGVSFNDHAFKKYDYTPLPRPELDLLYAATIANAANPWFVIYWSNMDSHAAEAARYWNGFINKHADLLAGARQVETIALLWSDSTALAVASAKEQQDSVHDTAEVVGSAAIAKCDHNAAFNGAYALLARSGLPFRVVTEEEMAAGLPGVEVLVAPSASAIAQKAFAGLEEFVRGGGILIADDQFAQFDEIGLPRDADSLAALLGGRLGSSIPSADANLDYIVNRGWVFKKVQDGPVPRPTRAYEFALEGGKAVARFYQPMGGRYDYLPKPGKLPAAAENSFGSGHVFYLPTNLFEHYASFAFEQHRQMVINMLRQYHRPWVQVEGLAGRGEVLWSEKTGKVIIHLLNYNGAIRPFADIQPLRNVTIKLKHIGPNVARALHADKLLHVTHIGDQVHLPELGVAETVVIEIPAERLP